MIIIASILMNRECDEILINTEWLHRLCPHEFKYYLREICTKVTF